MLSFISFALLAFLAASSNAKTVVYNWDVTWVNASPDGFARPVIGINNQWPCPSIEVTKGDRVQIHTRNMLGNETTSLHFHGLFQHGSNTMDGPSGVTQCPIQPGGSLTYDFVIDQPGTYWYHSHNMGQYIDGIRGPITVHDPAVPYKADDAMTITLSDWYHDQAPDLLNYFLSAANEKEHKGAEPIPKSALMQDTQNAKFNVAPNKTYLLRIVNMGVFAGQYFSVDGHQMTVVEIDGVYVEPQKTDQIYLTVAQRCSVLISTKSDASKNFAISAAMDTEMFDSVPPGLDPNVYGFLVYDAKKSLPKPAPITTFAPLDEMTIVPKDHMALLSKVDHQIVMTMDFFNDGGINRATVNNVTYIGQKVPPLYTALTTGSSATNPAVYGVNSNAFVLKPNEVVEIVVNNHDTGNHPWHLHGHNFQVVARSAANVGDYPGAAATANAASSPVRRDTVTINTGGWAVLRFKADNPGVWLFHCHIEWHVEAGLSATIIESPTSLQGSLNVPSDHLKSCKDQEIKTSGNAAGNTKDFLDLRGAITTNPKNNWGALTNPPSTRTKARSIGRSFIA